MADALFQPVPVSPKQKQKKRSPQLNAPTKKAVEAERVKQLIEHRQALRAQGLRVVKKAVRARKHPDRMLDGPKLSTAGRA
jgi:hypothetical protein